MIRKVTLRNFKRFGNVDITLPGHVVLAGPNNTGKTTLLQALAAWELALTRWQELNTTAKPQGTFPFKEIARPDFLAVPVRSLDLIWYERRTGSEMSIGVHMDDGRSVTMEFRFDKEQIRVRPSASTHDWHASKTKLNAIYVPPMTGLVPDEPLLGRDETIDARLAEGRPGEVLRNLLVRAGRSETAWRKLEASIDRLFGYRILPPNEKGRSIIAEYEVGEGGTRFDIASAGSGFQQVLMLLTFLVTRPGSVLLLDEPDAHLHVLLQDAIYSELRAVAAEQHSQLILATHSEVIINSVDPSELMVMYGQPRVMADSRERQQLIRGLKILSNTDVMLASSAPGILYVEGYTDIEILRAWAKVLNHPATDLLTTRLFWHKYSEQTRPGAEGFPSADHFNALRLVHPAMKGLEIQDRDGNPHLPETAVNGDGLQLVRWGRYEIESYLVHPAAIERFIESQVGTAAFTAEQRASVRAKCAEMLTQAFVDNPMREHLPAEAVFREYKARERLIPPLLSEGGLQGFPYTRYHEIAAVMQPAEIPPEVVQKLDAICDAFGVARTNTLAAPPAADAGTPDPGAGP
ncbi:MAG: hypothetical protein CHACPFDD_02285 [Phycisphaerae bacterium]|nr:hypothetical protein [Phycisphaerae bacterium]